MSGEKGPNRKMIESIIRELLLKVNDQLDKMSSRIWKLARACDGGVDRGDVEEEPESQAGPNPDQFEPYGNRSDEVDPSYCGKCISADEQGGARPEFEPCFGCTHLDVGEYNASSDNFAPRFVDSDPLGLDAL